MVGLLYFRCVVEYDVESFGKISFLMEWHNFFFLITSEWSFIYYDILHFRNLSLSLSVCLSLSLSL